MFLSSHFRLSILALALTIIQVSCSSSNCDCWSNTKSRKLLVSTFRLAREKSIPFGEIRSADVGVIDNSSNDDNSFHPTPSDITNFLSNTLTPAFCSRVFLEGDSSDLLSELEGVLGDVFDRSKFGGHCPAGEALLTLLCADTVTHSALFRTAANIDVTDYYLAKGAYQWEVFLYLYFSNQKCFEETNQDEGINAEDGEHGINDKEYSFSSLGLTPNVILANYQDYARKFHSSSIPRSVEYPSEAIGMCGVGKYELGERSFSGDGGKGKGKGGKGSQQPEGEECIRIATYPGPMSKTECFGRMMSFYGDREQGGLHPVLRGENHQRLAPRSLGGSPDLDEDFVPIEEVGTGSVTANWEKMVHGLIKVRNTNSSSVSSSSASSSSSADSFSSQLFTRSFRGEYASPITFQGGRHAPDTFFLRADGGCEIAECQNQGKLSKSLALVFLSERVTKARVEWERANGAPIAPDAPLSLAQFLMHVFSEGVVEESQSDVTKTEQGNNNKAKGGAVKGTIKNNSADKNAHTILMKEGRNNAVIFSLLCGSRAWIADGYFPALWRHTENQSTDWVERATQEHARIAGTRIDIDVFASLGARTPWNSMLFTSKFRWEGVESESVGSKEDLQLGYSYCREKEFPERGGVVLSGLDLDAEEAIGMDIGKLSNFRAHQINRHEEGYKKVIAQMNSAVEKNPENSAEAVSTSITRTAKILSNIRINCALFLVWPAEKHLLDDHLIATLPYCDGVYILVSLSDSEEDERAYWNLQARLGSEQATGRIRNYQILNLFPTIPPDVWFESGQTTFDVLDADGKEKDYDYMKSKIREGTEGVGSSDPSKSKVPRNLLQKAHAGVISIADAEDISIAAENWNGWRGTNEGRSADERPPLSGSIATNKNKKNKITNKNKNNKNDPFPPWICLLESDLYFVPENVKRFIFSRGYELDQEPRWVGLLHNHRVHAEGYLLEPLQAGCFNRPGLGRYAQFLLGRAGSAEDIAMKNALHTAAIVARSRMNAGVDGGDTNQIHDGEMNSGESRENRVEKNSNDENNRSLAENQATGENPNTLPPLHDLPSPDEPILTCRDPFSPLVNMGILSMFTVCVKEAGIRTSSLHDNHDHHGRAYWAGMAFNDVGGFVPRSWRRSAWPFQRPTFVGTFVDGQNDEKTKSPVKNSMTTSIKEDHWLALNGRLPLYWQCLGKGLEEEERVAEKSISDGIARMVTDVVDIDSEGEVYSPEGALETDRLESDASTKKPLFSKRILISNYPAAFDGHAPPRKKNFSLRTLHRMIRIGDVKCPTKFCGTTTENQFSPKIWGYNDHSSHGESLKINYGYGESGLKRKKIDPKDKPSTPPGPPKPRSGGSVNPRGRFFKDEAECCLAGLLGKCWEHEISSRERYEVAGHRAGHLSGGGGSISGSGSSISAFFHSLMFDRCLLDLEDEMDVNCALESKGYGKGSSFSGVSAGGSSSGTSSSDGPDSVSSASGGPGNFVKKRSVEEIVGVVDRCWSSMSVERRVDMAQEPVEFWRMLLYECEELCGGEL